MTPPALSLATSTAAPPLELRSAALQALQTADLADKVALPGRLWAQSASLAIASNAVLQAGDLPGRPALPTLVAPDTVPRRSPFTPAGLAALVHSIAHIEFNAINLALDAVWRFPGLPETYYRDWLQVAAEEAHHFQLLQAELAAQGHAYGDFPAHDGLWTMCERTAGDVVARMALVPRTLEARGLDASPLIQARLVQVGTPAARRVVDILEIILRDEVGHVAVGNRWYAWLCARAGLEPVAHYRALSRQHRAPRPKPPLNLEARRRAGFTDTELAELLAP